MIRKTMLLLGAALCLDAAAADQARAPAPWKDPETGMEFVQVPKGCFLMGNAKAVAFREEFPGLPLSNQDIPFDDELPQHEVCVDAFWMARFEVRADQWQRIMGGSAKRADAPAAKVTWQQANAFAARLTERSGGKHRFRLPTEAEWEYACRAGAKDEIVPKQGELADVAWYGIEPTGLQNETQAVGKLGANAFGLHDMLGNVWEWVQDSYEADGYATHGLFGPVVDTTSPNRVIRGASYRSQPLHVRCAKRAYYAPGESLNTIGLRLVRIP